MKRSRHPIASPFKNRSVRKLRRRRGSTSVRPAGKLSLEILEERRLLAVAAGIPPGISNSLDFLSSIAPEEVREALPDEIRNFPGTTLAYQAFPQEINEVSVDGNALNFFLLIDEAGDNVPIIRLGPAITEDLIEEIKVGLIDLVGDVEFPVSQLFGFDLPGSSAIVPNPQAIAQFFPFFQDVADGLDSLLEFGVPDITIPEVRFPSLEIPDLGIACPCEIIPEFTLIPETTLFPGFTIEDVLPDPLVDVIRGISDFIEGIGPGGIYVNTLDGPDTIDLSNLTGIEQNLFGGTGADTIYPGGGQQSLEALGLPPTPGFRQPSIRAFGGDGRDTIFVNPRFNTDDFRVDGGAGNDILKIEGGDGNDIIELEFSSTGQLEKVNFLAPNPSAGEATNATRRLTLPADTIGGSFTLTLDTATPETTDPIAFDATAGEIESALAALASIGDQTDVNVTGPVRGPWEIEFAGDLAGEPVAALIPDGANLVRRSGNVTVARTEQGDPTRGDNEIQRITLPTEADGSRFITGGTFTLTYDGPSGPETTAPIRYTASPTDVEQALSGLTSLGSDDVRVTGLAGGPWLAEFTGDLALQPQSELIADGSNLTGGVSPTITQVDGVAREQSVALPAPRGGNVSLGGTFKLGFDGDATVPLAWNAPASAVESALQDLPGIGAGNVDVSGSPGGPYQVALTGTAGLSTASLITTDASGLTGGVELDVEETTPGNGTNEVQRISAPLATGGTFRLTFDNGSISRTTGDLPFDATVGELQAALEALTSVGGAQNVIVRGADGGPWEVEFNGELAAQEQIELSVDDTGLVADVVPPVPATIQDGGGGDDEVQSLSAPVASGGTFTLTFDDGGGPETTDPIDHDASPASLEAALLDLANVSVGEVSVTGSAGGPWEVEFVGGLGDTDLALLTVDGSELSGAPVVTEQIAHVAGDNEVQTLSLLPEAQGGEFTLTFDGETTSPLPHDATAADVEQALQALASLGGGAVSVTSANTTGGPWRVEFEGRFAKSDQPEITGNAGGVSGGFADSEIDVNLVADGVNEEQTVTMPAPPQAPGAGTFRLSLNANNVSGVTGEIPFDATASEVQSALDAIAPGDVQVTSANSEGGPWTAEFTGDLAGKNVALMTIDARDLSRNDPIEVIEVREAGPTNELQTVTLPAQVTGGEFTLTFDSSPPGDDGSGVVQTTTAIPYDASPADVKAALEALDAIDPDDIVVRGGVGDPGVSELTQGGGGANERQRVAVSPLAIGGTFTLTFDGETTANLDAEATAEEVEDALADLDSIRAGNVLVSGDDGGPFTVEFVGSLGDNDQPLISADGANLTQFQNGPWTIEFRGAFAGQPVRPLEADGSELELTGLNPRVAELTQGSDGRPLVLASTTFTELVSIEQLVVEGNGGDDRLIVNGAHNFPLGLVFDGGDGIDQLDLISNDDAPSFVSPIFPDDTQGVLTLDRSEIQIADVEGGITFDASSQAGIVSFTGTDESNDIRLAGTSSSGATLARDGQVTTTLANFGAGSALSIDGAQGDDAIAIAPGSLTAFDSITIAGGGPSGADSLIVEGTLDDDVFSFTPDADSAKAGAVTINGIPIEFSGMEGLTIEGLEGLDELTVNEPSEGSHDNILFQPAVANDGSFRFTSQVSTAASAIAYVPVVYAGIETRRFDTGSGADVLTASTDDLPGVNSSVEVIGGNGSTTLLFGDQPTTFVHDVATPDLLSLEVGTAVDDVKVQPGIGIEIAVNTGIGEDRLVYEPFDESPVRLDLATARIVQDGVGDVTFTSAEQVAVAATGNALSVHGLAFENRFVYTPQGPAAGRLTHADLLTQFEFTGVDGTFSVIGGAAVSDQVIVAGSGSDDTLAVDLATRQVRTIDATGTELKTLNLDPNVERVGIDGGRGNDLVRVAVPDSLVNPLHVDVNGGLPETGDRLVFVDDGVGNLVLHREGPGQRSGSITIDGLAPVSYEQIGRVDILPIDPVTGGTGSDGNGRVVVLDTDIFEHNSDRLTATPFADLEQATSLPTIDPAARVDAFGEPLPGDEDWYRYVAATTATLQFGIDFDPVGTLANGSAGLPGDGELRVDVYDADGNPIDRFGGEGPATHTVGVEEGEAYFLRVRGATPDAVNRYEFNVVSTDEVGPRVSDVFVTTHPDFELFDPKPSIGPTPAVRSLTVRIEDPVARRPGFLYEALDERIAAVVGHYRLVGDHSGPIAIDSVEVVNDPRTAGELATASIRLRFADPLPDDRFTLTVADDLVDPVGNRLDGESDASTPQPPRFPSGDGVAGGEFVARFTVDSRPEIGTVSQGLVYVDINGNSIFDPEGRVPDAVNRDFVYQFGTISDAHFAGNFADAETGVASGFDKLGVYGLFEGSYSFMLDTDDDGVGDFASVMPPEYQVNGVPVAGDFSAARDGDEIGLFDGTAWYLDLDGSGQIESDERIPSDFTGLPFVGDFNGDGNDDLATFNNDTNVFTFDLDRDGIADAEFAVRDDLERFPGLSGFTDRPVAGDLNLDGIDDIGLWTKGRAGVLPREAGEFFFWVSDGQGDVPADVFDAFSPAPLGNDLFAQFGDELSLPIFGNFDPPLEGQPSNPGRPSLRNLVDPHDVNGDGRVTALDALLVINTLSRPDLDLSIPDNMGVRHVAALGTSVGYLDTSGDGKITALDALQVINRLQVGGAPDGEGETSVLTQRAAAVDHVLSDEDDEDWLSDNTWQRDLDDLARGLW